MQLKEGSELQNGKYRIIRVIGQGGFGITYLAENTFLDRQIAIKEFFPKDFCGRDNTSHLILGTQNNAETVEKLKARFLKEAKNIAKLDHPGIIKIHDIFEENNTAYYVMDYIEGENLNELVKRQGSLSESKAVEYIRKVGDALDYIHSRNMTHFDVKPANIMVRRSDDQPILIDFGLSKQYDAHGDATSTLMQGVSHGYSPIELYNPGSLSSFSPQTDVYSLGATLYYLLTGIVPPSASEILENGITIPSSISDANSSAILNAMSVSRSKRPQNIPCFIEKLSNNGKNLSSFQKPNSEINEETIFINSESKKTELEAYSDLKEEYTSESDNKSQIEKYAIIGIVICIIAFIGFAIFYQSAPEEDSNNVTTNSYSNVKQTTKHLSWNSPLGFASYTGEINANNEPDGKGVATILEGQYKGCVYDGDFVNGTMEGYSNYTQSNGDTFQGSFHDNKYYYGKYSIKSTGEYFEGYFDSNGQPSQGNWYDRNGKYLSEVGN
ncbi:MAG: protein kinase [Muribaculaceae bacterium]|nr:protein kinase [Muribaculaceae bacterium]